MSSCMKLNPKSMGSLNQDHLAKTPQHISMSISPMPKERQYKFFGGKRTDFVSVREVKKGSGNDPSVSTHYELHLKQEMEPNLKSIRKKSRENSPKLGQIKMTETLPRMTGDQELDFSLHTSSYMGENIHRPSTPIPPDSQDKVFRIQEKGNLLECIEYKFPYLLPASASPHKEEDDFLKRPASPARPRR